MRIISVIQGGQRFVCPSVVVVRSTCDVSPNQAEMDLLCICILLLYILFVCINEYEMGACEWGWVSIYMRTIHTTHVSITHVNIEQWQRQTNERMNERTNEWIKKQKTTNLKQQSTEANQINVRCSLVWGVDDQSHNRKEVNVIFLAISVTSTQPAFRLFECKQFSFDGQCENLHDDDENNAFSLHSIVTSSYN